jgi:hypothetical protein
LNLDIKKSLRFSKDEYQKIEDQLKKLNVNFSEFGRSQILQTELKTNCSIEKIYQLQKIGTNLNQIAKVVNQNKSDLEKIEILSVLKNIEDEIKKL